MKNLNYVASLVQLDLEDWTTHKRVKIIQYCIDCYKDVLRYKTDSSVSVAYLQPNEVLNAPWPADYEYYTKMAINIGGRYITLTLNNEIPLIRKMDCGEETVDMNQVDLNFIDPGLYAGAYFFAPHYRAGQFVGELYSLGGGYNEAGYFRIDFQKRQFQFANIPQTEIVMEYVADTKTNGSTIIRYMDVPVIRAYVHWKLKEYDKKVNPAEKERAFWQFNAAFSERKKIGDNSPTLSEFLDEHWKGIKSTVKR